MNNNAVTALFLKIRVSIKKYGMLPITEWWLIDIEWVIYASGQMCQKPVDQIEKRLQLLLRAIDVQSLHQP